MTLRVVLTALAALSVTASLVHAQDAGQELYTSACAACHGSDGKGAADNVLDPPVPDFSDCAFATPEPDPDWMAVVHQGGPVRAFDAKMPAFGDALSTDEIQRVLDYVRGFCSDRAWPRGELNLPRALVTEKAYPENEAVLTMTVGVGDFPSVTTEFLYERRLGARHQVEIAVPLAMQDTGPGGWQRGLGDISLAVKSVLFHSLEAGTIVSLAGEVVLPTGREAAGLGKAVGVFEPFVAVGQVLPRDGFFQVQAGMELSLDRNRVPHEIFWKTAIGRTFIEDRFGRAWSPMVELVGARAFEEDDRPLWDVVPQVQVTLSKRQHVMLSAGVRMPLNRRGSRPRSIVTYLLWDWADGGLFAGWR